MPKRKISNTLSFPEIESHVSHRRQTRPPARLQLSPGGALGYPHDALVTAWSLRTPVIGWVTFVAEPLRSNMLTRMQRWAYRAGYGGVFLASVVPRLRTEGPQRPVEVDPATMPELLRAVAEHARLVAYTAGTTIFPLRDFILSVGDLQGDGLALLRVWLHVMAGVKETPPRFLSLGKLTDRGFPRAWTIPEAPGVRPEPWDFPAAAQLHPAELAPLVQPLRDVLINPPAEMPMRFEPVRAARSSF